MKRILNVQSLYLIMVFVLIGCGAANNIDENFDEVPKVTNETMQMQDFKVTISVENDLNVHAAITYVGDDTEKLIYHGGSIFFFNVYQQDGDFEYLGGMNQPLLKTTLVRNEPYIEYFNGIDKLKLKPGIYEFEAIADFEVNETKFKIPVSKIKEIR